MQIDSLVKSRWFKLIRVCAISKRGGGRTPRLDVYVGRKYSLDMDPTWLKWKTCEDFLDPSNWKEFSPC